MVIKRRLGPLMLLVGLAWGLLLARSYQVQVLEHDFWAREATNLGRSWEVEPYRRGAILDRKRRPIVRDEEAYELEFVWRDFRRGHPLGQVCEARSLLCLRSIPLTEAYIALEAWALELIELSPRAIDDFGRGAALHTATLAVPATSAGASEQRGARRAHLHYYLRALLEPEPSAVRKLRELQGSEAWNQPYVELLASLQQLNSNVLRERVQQRVRRSARDLERLALHFGESEGRAQSLLEWLPRLDLARQEVDDVAADDLFEAATGFAAWRLNYENLARIDLSWLRQTLFWDEERLERWRQARGGQFDKLVELELAPLAIARFKRGAPEPATRFLDSLAGVFRPPTNKRSVLAAAPTSWREIDELVVLNELGDLFAGVDLPDPHGLGPVLPFQELELREGALQGLLLVDRALQGAGDAASFDLFANDEKQGVTRAAVHLFRAASDRERANWKEEEARAAAAVLREWNRRLQERIGSALDEAGRRQAGLQKPEQQALVLRELRRKAALEERDYAVRDRGSRPLRILRNPSYDLVRLVARFPERFAGFGTRTVARRVALALDSESEPRPLAEALIGKVQPASLLAVVRQEEQRRELVDLTERVDRSREEEELLRELVAESLRAEELLGSTGIEGYFDGLLAGRNGFRETQGLEERARANRSAFYQPAVDGRDLTLTLDLDLQRAAQATLEHPHCPPGIEHPDFEWFDHPVGAIVLMTVSGDVLALASTPTQAGEPGLYQDGQRATVMERSLRVPLHQPPGSVFKPFVAAWAMQNLGLDPRRGLAPCMPEPGGLPRWGHVHCHSRWGHSLLPFAPIDLSTALRRSCNVYFANLGDQLYTSEQMHTMMRLFGFGQPTGIRSLPSELAGRVLFEDVGVLLPPSESLHEVQRQRLANGLSYISATPLQVARGYAALASGYLPDVRILQGLEASQLARQRRPLEISAEVLNYLKQSLVRVVEANDGSAYQRGLDRATLGFQVALKTGSADYREGRVPVYPVSRASDVQWEQGMRKHAWVAGWFPADDPQVVFTVYVHDTSTTSGYSAVYVAAQLLQTEGIQAYLREVGVEVKER